jgi:NAD-dependent DNA ligase
MKRVLVLLTEEFGFGAQHRKRKRKRKKKKSAKKKKKKFNKIFAGFHFAFTGLERPERAQLESLITKNGGTTSTSLSIKNTHLIGFLTKESEKVKYIKNFDR